MNSIYNYYLNLLYTHMVTCTNKGIYIGPLTTQEMLSFTNGVFCGRRDKCHKISKI